MDKMDLSSLPSSTILIPSKTRKFRCTCTRFFQLSSVFSIPLFSSGLQRSSLIVPLDGYANAMTALENGMLYGSL